MATPLKPVKGNNCSVLAGIIVLSSCLFTAHAQSPPLQLRLERRTNAFDLTVSSLSATGALFIYQAADLQTLVDSPSLLLETNTVSTNDLRVPIAPPGGLGNQGFFSATHWPGRPVEEFGVPENYPDEPPPEMILLTSGVPTNLISGQAFTVDFFVTDPAGQLLSITQAVSIRVLRQTDGVIHPDAQVSPATGQMIGGHLRLTITITASTSLEGYTLGLGPDAAARNLTEFLKTAFNLGPAPLSDPTREALLQTLEQRRTDNADAGPSWSYPLTGSGHLVSGTFGEWRGKDNKDVHRGIDLAAVAASTVVASRGGVVSHHGTLEAMGDYLVLDHGAGWFSRYLHLDAGLIQVRVGEGVARGATLATGLYSAAGWPQHLHFEIRHGANQAQWNVGLPAPAQDPLQTPSIFPVPAGVQLPQLKEIGLTRSHPGETAFVKGPPNTDVNGPVYLFVKFYDLEGGNRLGLRARGFQPEGLAVPVEIRPIDDAAITALLPPGTGTQKGFARYGGQHALKPDTNNWFRYWWRWDTSAYAADRRGPRSFTVTGVDHGGATATFNFTFGPQIKDGVLTPLSAQQYQFTIAAHLGANTIPAFVQPDQYKLEIIQANQQPLTGVTWSGPMAGNYTKVFNAHVEESVYTFTLPGGVSPDSLKLRVSSRLATNIAHEICLCGGPNMALIPAGSFTMGNTFSGEGYSWELPLHTVYVSAFYMDKYEVTKALWDEVYNWAITHGYSFDSAGLGKAANHPVHTINRYDMVKWCNARSEKEGRVPAYYTSAAQTTVYRSGQVTVDNSWAKWNAGYRLPTEVEWEKAARGGASGHRFPWADADTISWSRANYYAYPSGLAYDVNPTEGYHPTFAVDGFPFTSPVGYFAPNGYGLYDMAGNVWEGCWDWYDGNWYSTAGATQNDTRGPTGPLSFRVLRGGSWFNYADYSRCALRYLITPSYADVFYGFRCVRGL